MFDLLALAFQTDVTRVSTFVLAIVLFFGVVAWWISIRPSHDRN